MLIRTKCFHNFLNLIMVCVSCVWFFVLFCDSLISSLNCLGVQDEPSGIQVAWHPEKFTNILRNVDISVNRRFLL